MNAVELLMPDGSPSGVMLCGTCKRGLGTAADGMADRCCTCYYCGKECRWGIGSPNQHDACRDADWARRAADRMAEAEKLDDWDGWVVTNDDLYHESLGDCIEHLECQVDDPADWPEFVFVAEPEPFPGLDVGHIIDNLTCDMFADAADHLRGVDDLSKAIAALKAAIAEVVSYHPNEAKAVRVPRPASEPLP